MPTSKKISMTWSSLKASLQGEALSDSVNSLYSFFVFFLFFTLSQIFSLKSKSSFLDSFVSIKPVINVKLIVNTKTHMELCQLFSFLKTLQALNLVYKFIMLVKGAKD